MTNHRVFAHYVMLAVGLSTYAAVRAEYPPASRLSETQPPTAADWFLYNQQRSLRCACGRACIKPSFLVADIEYYPCDEQPRFCAATHRSFRGCYGQVYPMPYYIPAIEIEVPLPGSCRRCGGMKTLPSHEILIP